MFFHEMLANIEVQSITHSSVIGIVLLHFISFCYELQKFQQTSTIREIN